MLPQPPGSCYGSPAADDSARTFWSATTTNAKLTGTRSTGTWVDGHLGRRAGGYRPGGGRYPPGAARGSRGGGGSLPRAVVGAVVVAVVPVLAVVPAVV